MRRILTFFMAMTWLASPGFAQEAQLNTRASRGGRAIPDRYIVVVKEGAQAAVVAERHGASPKHVYSTVLNGFSAQLSRGQLQQLLRDADVKYVDEDGVMEVVQDMGTATVQPGATWGIDKLDQNNGAGTDGNYNYTDRGAAVNVYVVDTGIRFTHNEFDGAALNRAKKAFDASGGTAVDCNGHGTHVAGTIGGTTYGVAKAARLYAVKVFPGCSSSGSWADFIAGADWVTNNHLKPAVVNASLGGGFIQAANDAVAKSVSWGVTWVVAAGNASVDACTTSPASTPEAITVGATDSANARAGFSNWGPCVDIHAPGVGVLSASSASDVATAVLNGTSMASPHVAGLAALYNNANKGAPGEIADAIHDSGVEGVVTGLPGGTPNLLAHKINGNLAAAGASILEPDIEPAGGGPWYVSSSPGWHHIRVRGTPGTNFNVELYRWNGVAWVKVAQKIGGSTNEYLKYFSSVAGTFQYKVISAAGTGTYDSWVIRPD